MFGQEEKEWLASLKEGDQVAIDVGSYGYTSYKIVTVTRVTPTGIIKTSDSRQFNPNGRERGGAASAWSRNYRLEPFTPQVLDHIERAELLSKLSSTSFKQLPTELLRKIIEAMEEEK